MSKHYHTYMVVCTISCMYGLAELVVDMGCWSGLLKSECLFWLLTFIACLLILVMCKRLLVNILTVHRFRT